MVYHVRAAVAVGDQVTQCRIVSLANTSCFYCGLILCRSISQGVADACTCNGSCVEAHQACTLFGCKVKSICGVCGGECLGVT